jgi:hypothetical protein
MNTPAQISATRRVLVLVLAAGAFAFSACGTVDPSPQGAPPAEDSGYWDGSLYPRPAEPDEPGVQRPDDGESVRAPRVMGGEPAVPTV